MTHFFKCFGGRHRSLIGICFLVFLLAVPPVAVLAQDSAGEGTGNELISVSVDRSDSSSMVLIETKNPVGYRYTVYDSANPARVTVDFPGMDVSKVDSPIQVESTGPLQEIRVSSLDLTSGKLGRVELLLTKMTDYKVSLDNNKFMLSFPAGPPGEIKSQLISGTPAEKEKENPAAAEPSQAAAPASTAPAPSMPEAEPKEERPAAPAKMITSVDLTEGQAVLKADGRIDKFKAFDLDAPPRLVVDIFGVEPGFKERYLKVSPGFSRIRVGSYDDKTRFVFDAAGGSFPAHAVKQEPDAVVVSWGKGNGEKGTGEAKPATADSPVTVEGVDFKVENGNSIVFVSLSGPAEIIQPTAKGDIINFGIRNAKISRALRRTIDASAFPSAVRLVTPYMVREDGSQNVRFAVQLKGLVPYSMGREGTGIKFTVENGPFAETPPPGLEKKEVPVPVSAPTVEQKPKAAEGLNKEAIPQVATLPEGAVQRKVLQAEPPTQPRYTGEKISLVFDDADIRKILQLIGEVSGLNIIAGEDVKGTITLRLVDVPWDQALDLILETKGLGMIREGNVVRVLPLEKIRERRQAELTAVKEERDLEPLVTELIKVSYTDLGNVAGPVKELLSGRGKITEDARNKQIIVTDVPSVIREAKKLVTILDTPERQVMIEARIVEADSSFSRDLGVKWGISYQDNPGFPGLNDASVGLGGDFLIAPPAAGGVTGAGLGSSFTFGRLGIDQTVLNLRISALESSGHGKIVSAPRVSTLNGGEATISQGTKIPYQSSGDNGLPKTEFVDANLELKVKPVINPDNSVILDITATNSSLGSAVPVGQGAAPSVDTKEARTKLLVHDGETTVIGGIFVENESETEVGVPLLMKIPYLGQLFKSSSSTKTRSELLIFITPRIVN